MKKHIAALVLLSLALAGGAMAAKDAPAMPGILANARFVYVTSYDGGQFNPNILSDDREAISRVQDSIRRVWLSVPPMEALPSAAKRGQAPSLRRILESISTVRTVTRFGISGSWRRRRRT